MPVQTLAALATVGAGLTGAAKQQVEIGGVKLGRGQWTGKGLPEDQTQQSCQDTLGSDYVPELMSQQEQGH